MIYKNETITIDDTSGGVGFTAANSALAQSLYGRDVKQVIFTVETAQIRAWDSDLAPTSSTGHVLNIGDVITVGGPDTAAFRAIRTGSTSGVISVAYEV